MRRVCAIYALYMRIHASAWDDRAEKEAVYCHKTETSAVGDQDRRQKILVLGRARVGEGLCAEFRNFES